MLLGPEMK